MRCSDISKGINTSHCCFHQLTWASELSAVGFVYSVLTPESLNTPEEQFWGRWDQQQPANPSSREMYSHPGTFDKISHFTSHVNHMQIPWWQCQQPFCADGPATRICSLWLPNSPTCLILSNHQVKRKSINSDSILSELCFKIRENNQWKKNNSFLYVSFRGEVF